MNEDEEEEKEADLFVPGSSYIKLLSLTPASVLGGIIYSVFEVTLQIYNHSDCTNMWLSCNGVSYQSAALFFFFFSWENYLTKLQEKM